MNSQRADLTFKHNLKHGRHGWLRLTPAYSIKLVHEILDSYQENRQVLDPFSGTGTTGLVCGERGINCQLLDINPFLVWLAQVKVDHYSEEQLIKIGTLGQEIYDQILNHLTDEMNEWIPPISHIERWWDTDTLNLLANLFQQIHNFTVQVNQEVKNLLLIAFCRVLIQWSNASFNHQSVSFKVKSDTPLFTSQMELELKLTDFLTAVHEIMKTASSLIYRDIRVILADARQIPPPTEDLYDCVITSPPYPNRMSYIRELRPYMYWLGYLNQAQEAGELDWQAIGGTWGIATSRLKDWKSPQRSIEHPDFLKIVQAIGLHNPLLGNYVHKYFVDISMHLETLMPSLARGADIYYVVGNSKFYDTLVPVEEIYASLFHQYGFVNVKIQKLRKRNSKKELFEFVVSARKPF